MYALYGIVFSRYYCTIRVKLLDTQEFYDPVKSSCSFDLPIVQTTRLEKVGKAIPDPITQDLYLFFLS